MHLPRTIVLVLAASIGALTAGCTPAVTPTPTPLPTVPSCVPEFGGTAFPCTQSDYEQSLRTQARYAEAERVYREYNERASQELVDRVPEPSEQLTELTSGAFRRDLPDLREAGLSLATYEGRMSIARVMPVQREAQEPGNLALDVCMDFSEWRVSFVDGSPGLSGLRPDRIIFDDAIGQARIVEILPGEGQSCE